jgi:hypothetical protein
VRRKNDLCGEPDDREESAEDDIPDYIDTDTHRLPRRDDVEDEEPADPPPPLPPAPFPDPVLPRLPAPVPEGVPVPGPRAGAGTVRSVILPSVGVAARACVGAWTVAVTPAATEPPSGVTLQMEYGDGTSETRFISARQQATPTIFSFTHEFAPHFGVELMIQRATILETGATGYAYTVHPDPFGHSGTEGADDSRAPSCQG